MGQSGPGEASYGDVGNYTLHPKLGFKISKCKIRGAENYKFLSDSSRTISSPVPR